ncbi:MAG: aldo/keto reductase [Flavobacteriaceae bacterium TMED171]|nr:aldo/keto reductase [Flavobacteriaceae bacterium]OUW33752.1 MAG: aldo/keto reductase [Flavobacteriaceae bacterium TMED171]
MTKGKRIISGTMNWGVWGKQLDTSSMAELIASCVEHGVLTFDHADIYGGYSTEAEFGKAFLETKIPREDLYFISKCGIQFSNNSSPILLNYYNYSKDYIVAQVENSLQNLQTDFLDLLLLHRPSPLMQSDDINAAIYQLITQGKIKAFGVSNFTSSQIDLIQESHPIVYNQIECSLLHYLPLYDGTLDYLTKNKIGVMAWSPLGKYFTNHDNKRKRIKKALIPLMEKYEAEEDELLLAWLMHHPAQIHPVIGTTKIGRIKKSVRVIKIQMEEIDWFSLLVASQGHEMP